jgi:hypothetical protein
MVPLFTSPGGKPVTALSGLTPRSPEMTEGPVLVTVVPANTAKDVAVPNTTSGLAADTAGVPPAPPQTTMAALVPSARRTASPAAKERRRRARRAKRIVVFTGFPIIHKYWEGPIARC